MVIKLPICDRSEQKYFRWNREHGNEIPVPGRKGHTAVVCLTVTSLCRSLGWARVSPELSRWVMALVKPRSFRPCSVCPVSGFLRRWGRGPLSPFSHEGRAHSWRLHPFSLRRRYLFYCISLQNMQTSSPHESDRQGTGLAERRWPHSWSCVSTGKCVMGSTA